MLIKHLISTTLMFVLFKANLSTAKVIMDQVPPSTSVSDAHRYFDERLQPVIEFYVAKEIAPLTFKGRDFYMPILARILKGVKIDEVNRMILDPATKVVSKVGTDFSGIAGLCKRYGDYDFTLTGLIPIAYEGRGIIAPQAWGKLVDVLLNTRGNKHHLYNRFCGIKVKETENHILMIESARYLTNQLMLEKHPNNEIFDNEKNGFNTWFLKHLQQFLKNDFVEYNSRPYQGHAIYPLENLISYAKDERIRTAATMVLDYLSAKFAVQSNRLRRQVPISRQKGYSRRDDILLGDHETARFAQLAGNFQIFQHNTPAWSYRYAPKTALFAGMSTYRAPDMILDMIINNDQTIYQYISHNAFEMYTKTPDYLISSGGRFWNFFDMGTGKSDAWAAPTNVIPTNGNELDRRDLLRIVGHDREQKRNNTCMYKNFACGLNVKLPRNLPSKCFEKKGIWTFINYTAVGCPLKYNYYAAVRIKSTPFPKTIAKNFGSFELMPASKMSFNKFKSTVLKNNKRRLKYRKRNVYVTADEDRIVHFYKGGLKKYPIYSINKRKIERKLSRWDFLIGNVLQSSGNGLVKVHNPKLRKTLVLDYRDPLNPKKYQNE